MLTIQKQDQGEVEQQSSDRAKREFNQSLDLIFNYLGRTIHPEMRPEVKVDPKAETSFYNPVENSVTLSEKGMSSGISHFEEGFHVARAYMQGHIGKERIMIGDDCVIEEFFGRLGENIGRRLVQGTTLEHLFENEKERECSRPKNIARQVLRDLEMDHKISEGINFYESGYADELEKAMDFHSRDVVNIYEAYKQGEVPYSMVQKTAAFGSETLKEILTRMPKGTTFDSELVGSCMDAYKGIFCMSIIPEEKLKDLGGENKEYVEGIERNSRIFLKGLEMGRINPSLYLRIERENSRAHNEGYLAAEIYMMQNPDYFDKVRDLMEYNDWRALDFIKKIPEPKGLLEKVNALAKRYKRMGGKLPNELN